MRPVRQTVHGRDGNCFAACLASVLEVNLAEVPDFTGWQDVRDWLRERGWRLAFGCKDGLAICSQRVLDGSIHAIVCRDGEMVHDPSPRQFGRPEFPVVLWTKLERVTDDSGVF